MACMNEDGQWIVLMGLLVAVALFFLALIVNQSALVGQTTAEGVLEFPKNDIRDLREAVFDYVRDYEALRNNGYDDDVKNDVIAISLERKNAVVNFAVGEKRDVSGRDLRPVEIHYNNGVTEYDETVYYWPMNEEGHRYGASPACCPADDRHDVPVNASLMEGWRTNSVTTPSWISNGISTGSSTSTSSPRQRTITTKFDIPDDVAGRGYS